MVLWNIILAKAVNAYDHTPRPKGRGNYEPSTINHEPTPDEPNPPEHQLTSFPAFNLSIIPCTACLLASLGANGNARLAKSRAFAYSPFAESPLAIPVMVMN